MKTYWTSIVALAGSGLTVAALIFAGPAAARAEGGVHDLGSSKSASVTHSDAPVTAPAHAC